MDMEVLKRAMKKKKKKRKLSLSSGSTLLNLATSGRHNECWRAGHYYWFVGDSDSGKTFLVLTALAEACRDERFANHRLIYDAPEGGALMDMKKFFGRKVGKRLEAPSEDGSHSELVEEFFYNVDDALKDGRPFIYILDSMDGLSDTAEIENFDKNKNAHRKGKEKSGSFGMGKAKINSTYIRRVASRLLKTDSILIVISQTRDAVNTIPGFGDRKTSAGGRALKFYATLQVWSSVKEKIKKTIKDKPRQLGILSKVQVKKNRLTGRDRTVFVPILHSVGVDDIGSCIDYLVDEKHWKKGTGGKIKATEFNFEGTREQIIRRIEEADDEDGLRELVGDVWNEIEEAIAVKRKPRYE